MIVGCPHCHLRYDISHRNPKEAVNCRCGASFMVPNLSSTARAWNCPNCGGATDSAKSKCEFCGVYLAFARCPECFTLVFEGAKFCHQCGANLLTAATSVEDKKTKLKCPRCEINMKVRDIGDYHVDHCMDCGGVWLDHEVLEKVLHDKGKQKTAQAFLGHQQSREFVRNDFKVTYLKCPHCSNLMHRRNFGKKSGVIVDECVAHGIWFDKNELAAVIQFSRSSMKAVPARQAIPIEETKQKRPSGFSQPVNQSNDDLWSIVGDLLSSLPDLLK